MNTIHFRRMLSSIYKELLLWNKSILFQLAPFKCSIQIIKAEYKRRTGRNLNINNPQRFTEKIQWRKIYDNSIIYTELSDKFKVREWVEKKIGSEYLIPLLGKWDSVVDIDFSRLPNKFVMKTNNGSRTNIIVRDKSTIDFSEMKQKLKHWLRYPFWCVNLEPHYKKIEPMIIAEQYMSNEDGSDLADYKFFCFDGIPRFCQVISNRRVKESIDFFDMDWNHLPFVGLNPECKNSDEMIKKPITFLPMYKIARCLSNGFSFVRVDLYEIGEKVYFGEMTFTPSGGYGRFDPDDWDFELGKYWQLDAPQINETLVNQFDKR